MDYVYRSWLKLQQKRQWKLDKNQRWLEILKSDDELAEIAGCSLEALWQRAAEILTACVQEGVENLLQVPQEQSQQSKKSRKRSDSNPRNFAALFAAYREADDPVRRSVIAYLLKHGCKLPTEPEDPKKFAERRQKTAIQVERSLVQLASRMPHGRDLTGDRWLETLEIATTTAPQDEIEARSWQDALLREQFMIPFPANYETNTDLTWSRNHKGRLCVRFNGLAEHNFEVYCGNPDFHWFERFLEDQEIKRQSKDQHSSSLFTLRSAKILWQKGEKQGHPWQANRLALQCTIDTRLWSQEGTEQVQKEKGAEIDKILASMSSKGDELNDNQQAFVKRKQSTLTKINTPFPRPNKVLYQGRSHILVGVSLGLEKPATVAVLDASTNKVLTYQSIRQLLGENYRLLNRQRLQQHNNARHHKITQKQGASKFQPESELGQHIDRLITNAIISLAKSYQAGSIVVPNLSDIRERIQSEVQAKAELAYPDLVEVQKKYAKQYRSNIHRWSHGRLISSIRSQAAQVGIMVEECNQLAKGTPQEIARELAIAAYQSRL